MDLAIEFITIMLSVDLSKTLPPKPYVYLSPLLPGLSFGLLVAIGNPWLVERLVVRLQYALNLGSVLTVFVALFSTFVIGIIFMTVTSLAQFAVRIACSGWQKLWAAIQRLIFFPLLDKATHTWVKPPATDSNPNPKPVPKRRSKWVCKLHQKVSDRVNEVPSKDEKDEVDWWLVLVRHFLRVRYGLAEDNLPASSFAIFQGVLIDLKPEDLRGSLLMNALESTGWAALVAARFAPELWSKWYLIFSWFLIGNGLFHDFFVAWRLNNPKLGNLLRIRAILREFPEISSGRIEPPATKTTL